MESKFNLYNEVIKYASYVRRYVVGDISAVHRDLKINLLDEIYHLKRFLISAQYTKGNIRVKNIVEMLVTISMLDIITNELLAYSKNKKHLEKSLYFLTNIKNMTFGWKERPE